MSLEGSPLLPYKVFREILLATLKLNLKYRGSLFGAKGDGEKNCSLGRIFKIRVKKLVILRSLPRELPWASAPFCKNRIVETKETRNSFF